MSATLVIQLVSRFQMFFYGTYFFLLPGELRPGETHERERCGQNVFSFPSITVPNLQRYQISISNMGAARAALNVLKVVIIP